MDASTFFLGVIALATAVMATVQLGMITFGAKAARRVDRLADLVEKELKPTLGRVNEMSGDLRRATTVVATQVERADQLLDRVAKRVDGFSLLTEDRLVEPIRQAKALLEGLRVAIAVLRGAERAAPHSEPAVVVDARRSG